MRKSGRLWATIVASTVFMCLILDSKAAILGAAEGLQLCISSVIPSLFPFLTVTIYLNNALLGKEIKFLQPLCKKLGVPRGAETLLLLGLVGGYPVGAHCINEACKAGMSVHTGKRLLSFCSNAGPAFIFGMMSTLFKSTYVLWLLWAIHIVSAVIVGLVLSERTDETCIMNTPTQISLPGAAHRAIRTMAEICGWVILFRVLLTFCQRWFLWILPASSDVTVAGILELTNGCHGLHSIANQGLRFILGSCFLSFGGSCVLMQTCSVTNTVGLGLYLPGKLMQTAVSFILSAGLQYYIFPADQHCILSTNIIYTVLLSSVLCAVYFLSRKKVVAFPRKMLYTCKNTK